MREWMNLINESRLIETVDIHPAVKSVEDGRTYINYPEGTLSRGEEDCRWCDGTGKDSHEPQYGCMACDGKGKQTRTRANCPEMNVSNRNMDVIAGLLGVPNDDDHGWIEPGLIPDIRRRLIKIKNGGAGAHSFDTEVSQSTYVDKSGEIPQIKRGATTYDLGVSEQQIHQYIDTLLEILDWAQKNGTGISWA